MSLPEGICERVVIGSQARLRIWCLRAYGFESLRSHIIKRSRSVPRSLFLCLLEVFWKTLMASRSRTPLSLRDISRGRMETSVAVSVARTLLRGRGVFPGLFFLRLRELFGETLRASRFRTPLSLRDISRGRTETSVAVSVARTFFRDRGVFPGLFFCRLREEFWRNAQGLAASYPSVTA